MTTQKRKPQAHRRPTVAIISQALDEAARDAVELHRQAGVPLATWRDGHLVLVPAEEIEPTGNGTKSRRRKS